MKAPVFERRATNLITLRVPHDPNVRRLRISGHKTLMGAFTAPVAMFTADVGLHFRSPSIVRRGVERLPDNATLRHATVLSFDPDDYQPLNVNLPFDHDILYVVLEGQDHGGAWLPTKSPILILPPAIFFGSGKGLLSVSGIAPNISATAGAVPPAASLGFALPRAARIGEVINLTSGEILLISTGKGMPMAGVPYGESMGRFGSESEVYVASASANTINFSIFFKMSV